MTHPTQSLNSSDAKAAPDPRAAGQALDVRRAALRRGVWLAAFVTAWNVIEGIVAVWAGLLASSVALISFGIDSGVEVTSAVVILWRLLRELYSKDVDAHEAFERRAARITGALLLLLAVYIVVDAGRRLLGFGAEAAPSTVGLALTALSLLIMPVVGWAKLKTAAELNSAALRADAFETITCAWLSLATLAGLGMNALWGWAWADPLAALAIVPLVVREGLEGWRGECNCHE